MPTFFSRLLSGAFQGCAGIDPDPYNLGYQAVKATLADKLPDSGIIYSDCKYLMGE